MRFEDAALANAADVARRGASVSVPLKAPFWTEKAT